MLIYLLNQLANMATPQELVTAARCYDCIPVGLRGAVMMYLQDAILAGGSGGCGIFPLTFADVPDAQAPPAGCGGIAYNEAGDVWVFNPTADPSERWEKIISA